MYKVLAHNISLTRLSEPKRILVAVRILLINYETYMLELGLIITKRIGGWGDILLNNSYGI